MMNTQPLVTISVPLFKCEEFLKKCLDSIRVQTYPNIEVTLINDQTPDNSVAIAEKYIEKHGLTNWRIYHLDKNSGLSVVRNRGIDTATGKYLFFLDSDDEILADCIEKLVKISEETGAEMTIAQLECEQLETGERSICIKIKAEQDYLEGNDVIMQAFAEGKLVTYAVNKLMRLDVIRHHQLAFVPGLFAQDELWTFHLMLKLEKIAICHEITYTYFLHKKSVIHNRNRRHFENWATITEHFHKALLAEKKSQNAVFIRTHLVNYKTMTLIMNWKAQQSDSEWLYSFKRYKQTAGLRLQDYFSTQYSAATKKKALKLMLPAALALRLFKFQYYR